MNNEERLKKIEEELKSSDQKLILSEKAKRLTEQQLTTLQLIRDTEIIISGKKQIF